MFIDPDGREAARGDAQRDRFLLLVTARRRPRGWAQVQWRRLPAVRRRTAAQAGCWSGCSVTVFSVTLLGSFVRFGAASSAVTTEAPHWRESRRGRIPEEPLALYEAGTVTLCSQPKSSPYLNYLIRLAPGLHVNGQ